MKNLLLLFILSLSLVSCFDNDRDDNLDLNTDPEEGQPVDTGQLIAEDSTLFGYLESLTRDLGIDEPVTCIIFVYPFTVIEYDKDGVETTRQVVENDRGFAEFLGNVPEEHYINLSFPISAELEDGSRFEVTTKEELQEAIEACIDVLHEQILAYCEGLARECVWVVTLPEESLPEFYDQSVFELPELGLGTYYHRGVSYENSWIFYFIDGQLKLNIFLSEMDEDDGGEEEEENPVIINWNFDWNVEGIGGSQISIRNSAGVEYILQKECEEENYCTEFIFAECELTDGSETAEFLLSNYVDCIRIMGEPFPEDPEAEPIEYVYSFHLTASDAEINENAIDPNLPFENTENPQPIFVRVEDTDPETEDFIVIEIALLAESCEEE